MWPLQRTASEVASFTTIVEKIEIHKFLSVIVNNTLAVSATELVDSELCKLRDTFR